MKHSFAILMLLFHTLLLLLSSCNDDTPSGKVTDPAVSQPPRIEEIVYETDNVFKFRELTGANGESIMNYSIQRVGDLFWFLNWYTSTSDTPGGIYYDIYNMDGVFQENLRLPDIIQQKARIVATPDGERFFCKETDASGMRFCCYDIDGNLLMQSEYYPRLSSAGGAHAEDMQFIGGDLYYYLNYSMFRFPMGDITQEAIELELPCYPEYISLYPDGRLCVSGPVESDFIYPTEHFLFDPTTGKSETNPLIQNGKTVDMLFENASGYYPIEDTIYAFCDDGFYAARGGETEQVINWADSGVFSASLGIERPLSDHFCCVSYRNPLSSGLADIGTLYLTQERRNSKREIVTLATIGLNSQDQYLLDAAVFLFNRDNPDYRIEYHNYYAPIYYTMGEANTTGYRAHHDDALYEAVQRQFEEDLLAGIVYNCYVFPEISPNRDLLADKGLFADLSPYLEEDQILGCVKTAYMNDEGTIALPFYMRISTLMTSQSILPPQEQLTYDVLMDIAAGLGEGETLFGSGSGVYENLKMTGQYEFLDLFNETCSFDSAESLEWMDFLMDVKNGVYSDEALQVLYEKKYTTYQDHYVSSLHVPEREIKLRTAKFFEMSFSTVESICAAQWLYSLDRINYCGYPSKDGPVIMMSCNAMFSAAAGTRSPNGVDAILDFLLSSEIQGCDYMQRFALPVSREGMIDVFPKYVHCRVLDTGKLSINSWLTLHPDAFLLGIICSDERMDEYNQEANSVFDVIRVTDEDRDLFIRFLDRAVVRTAADDTLRSIIDEEMSYVESGVRSPAEAGKILQSRVGIYLAE